MKQGTAKFLMSLLVALSATLPSSRVLADDDAKTGKPASADGVKVDAPKPGLTERERWLLDKVEQLERRVAELESKGQPAATAASRTVSAVASAPPGETGMAAPSAASPDPTTSAATAITPPPVAVRQPTEKATTATAKPEKAAPFAYADFTWLNGNPRTKESPMDT